MTNKNIKPTRLRWLLAGLLVMMSCFGGVCSDEQIAFFLLGSGCSDCSSVATDFVVIANGIPIEDDEVYNPGSSFVFASDQEPEEPGLAAALTSRCLALVDVVRWVFGIAPTNLGEEGVAQRAQLLSGGFAIEPLPTAAARYRGTGSDPAPLQRVFMTNAANDTLAVWDPVAGVLTNVVPVGRMPRGVGVTPDGARVFTANEDSGNVSAIDVATLTEIERVTLPGEAKPHGGAMSSDGSTFYVVSAEATGLVYPIDTNGLVAGDAVRVGRFPVSIALSPDGTLAYVANSGDDRVSVIDTATNTVVRNLTVQSPHAIAFHPNGNRVYVTSRSRPGRLVEVSTANDEVLREWEVGESPEGLAINADGTRAYVTNRLSDFVSVISLLTGEEIERAEVPRGVGPALLLPHPGL